MNKPVLFVIFRLPAPYFEPLFERIQEEGSIQLVHFYEMKGREGTAWGLDNIIKVKNSNIQRYFGYQKFNSGINQVFNYTKTFFSTLKLLTSNNPDYILIHGYSYPSTWAGILWAKFNSKRFGLRSDSNFFNDNNTGVKQKIKEVLITKIVKLSDHIFYIGSANKKYWEKYGASSNCLIEAKYAVDNTIFFPNLNAIPSQEERPIKFLFTGRLIPRKNIIPLINGFKIAYSNYKNIQLTIAGDGPDQEQLKRFIIENPTLPISYLGKVDPQKISQIYQDNDVFICPYENEPWGLAINEAMSSGLALVAPKNGTCGAAYDLLFPNENGIEIKTLSINGISNAFEELVKNHNNLSRYKKKSLEIISNWTFESTKEALIKATKIQNH